MSSALQDHFLWIVSTKQCSSTSHTEAVVCLACNLNHCKHIFNDGRQIYEVVDDEY